ncbi:MAG: efflux RND transporter periplasmic adaptor subunit [Planctomycetes bacterium]|nr:efflux RND transporter periplasmic adaptor subunit [Planctomycetota bacterium]
MLDSDRRLATVRAGGCGAVRPLLRVFLWVSLGVFTTACDKAVEAPPEKPRLVSAIKLEATGALIEADFPGRAEAAKELDLSFRVTGLLAELPAKVGDSVKAGQTLAQLDRRDFQVAIDVILGRLAKAQADVEVAQSDYDRGVSIQKENPGAISQAVIDQRVGALKQAQANVVSVKASLEDAKNALADTTLKAPFDAVVVERLFENYEEVQAKKPVYRLVDASKVKMTFQLPEQHISRLPDVASYICRFDAFPDVDLPPAQVYEVGTEALRTTRTYPVTLIMDQPKGVAILPGMSGKVHIRLKTGALETANGMTVPVTAVFADASNQKFVWVVDAQSRRVSRKSVQVGHVVRQGVLVEGLTPGMWIVTAGVHTLQDNQEVRLPQTDGGAS